jgi:hypothetical protein
MTLSRDILIAALAGFNLERKELDQKIAGVEALLKGGETQPTTPAATGPRKKRSAAARQKMALAQKERWARVKGDSTTPRTPEPKAKRKLSAAGRAAIVAALKKRWAAKKAAPKKAGKTPTSKKAAASQPE